MKKEFGTRIQHTWFEINSSFETLAHVLLYNKTTEVIPILLNLMM